MGDMVMFDEIPKPNSIVLEFAYIVQSKLLPFIRSQRNIQDKLGMVVEHKGGDHYAYQIDEFANRVLYEVLKEHGLNCHVFSEEGGWSTLGDDPEYYVICDPYCNTSLTMRSFRESAAAICIADLDGEFVSCAIGDFQIDRIFYADQTGAYLWELDGEKEWSRSRMHVSQIKRLDEAFVAASLLKQSRRTQTVTSSFYHNAKTLYGVDGAIMIGRLAAGHIDAYLDPFKGQPLYEVPCCELVLRAGGFVSDVYGKPFCLRDIVSGLRKNPKERYKLVASSTEKLHQEILNGFDSLTQTVG
jgi:fructose-1,6-bisphosphatase/inositol monophosphatase family enzyme